MDNLRVTHVDGEPPIYTEMKTVPVSLESCILNSEDDYQYGGSQTLEADHFNDGNLSAEEINTMIMLNEGTNIMSTDRVEVKPKKIKTSRQGGASLRKSSDIKKILTNDLPAKGRFLSTKSLQRLSGAPKLTPKKRRFTEEADEDSLKSKTKQRKERTEIQKNTKNDKLSSLKIKRVKRLDKKAKFVERETKDHETVKMRRLKELERDSEKKSLSKKSKIIAKKKKEKDVSTRQNPMPKMLKKKVLEGERRIRKSEDKNNETSCKEDDTNKSCEKVTNLLSEGESDVKVASRSGRIRKLRVPSDDFVTGVKEVKSISSASVKPNVAQENGLEVPSTEFKSNDTTAAIETAAQKSDEKPRALNTELLQDVLSESVESWFDISPELQKKGKRTRRKFKIIPQANASDSEFVEETVKPLEPLETETKTADTVPVQDSNSGEIENAVDKEEIKQTDLEENEGEKKEDCQNDKNTLNSMLNVEKNEKVDKDKVKRELLEVKSVKMSPKKRGRLRGSLKVTESASSPKLSNARKLKPNRQITSFSKKRRRVRNMVMLKGLKNYGEKIDFNQKIAPDTEKEIPQKEENSNSTSSADKSGEDTLSPSLPEMKHMNLKLMDICKLPLNSSAFKSIVNVEELLKPEKSPLKRSYSFEDLRNKPAADRCQQSAEMPADLPSRSESVKLFEKELTVSVSKLIPDAKDAKTGVSHTEKDESSKEEPLSEKKLEEKGTEEEEKCQASNDECETEVVYKSVNQRKLRQNTAAKRTRGVRGRRKKLIEEKADVDVSKSLESKEKESVPEEGEGKKEEAESSVNAEIENESVVENVTPTNVADSDAGEEKSEPKNVDIVIQKESEMEDATAVEQEVDESGVNATKKDFSLGSMSKCIPFKKRGMQGRRRQKGRPRGLKRKSLTFGKEEKQLGENVPPKEENTIPVLNKQKDPPDRRKSYREIKLTPKLVDMIATSTKRPRKFSSLDNRTNCVMRSGVGSGKTDSVLTEKDSGYSNLIKRATASPPKTKPEPEDSAPMNTSIENYLQSKMEQNAVNFESAWVPGDLVWARFAGNPFWPSLILRDPFRNEEYSRVKYLGRLPRLFVHVQFLADWGRRAWGPEMYLMNFNGIEHFEKLKANLPPLGPSAARKDVNYQQAFIVPKKLESSWNMAVKEADTLMCKTRDERITYMKIKYPLVKYAESIANGHLVPNVKGIEQKGPVAGRKKGRSAGDQWGKENDNVEGNKIFECVNTSKEEDEKASEKTSPKITLKIVRSPHRGRKRKNKNLEGADGKLLKRVKKELFDDDYIPSDSGSNGDKCSEVSTFKQKRTQLFRGARVERVCQICLEIMEGEKIMKCKGVCQGLFHVSCANKMNVNGPPAAGEGTTPKSKRGRRKRPKKASGGEEGQNPEASTEEDWRCNDCIRGENPCFVCKSRAGNRQRCRVVGCGKFYHQKCLKLYPQTIYNQGAPISKLNAQQKKILWDAESPNQQILSCPLHVCHTCASDNPSDTSMKYMYERLVRCVECPSAYHLGNYCVPAGSRILNTSQIICSKHCDADTKKSHVNISWCFICNMGGSLICCDWCPSSFHLDCLNIKPPEDSYICEECESGRFPLHGEVVWVKLGRYRWWPARVLFPQEIPPNIKALSHKPWEFAVRFYGSNDHYWLSRGRVFLYQEGDSEQNFKSHRQVDKVYQKAVQEASRDYFLFQEERKQRREGSVTSATLKPPPYVKIKTNRPVGKVQLGNTSQKEPPTCDCDPNMELPCSPWSDCLNRMLLLECDPNYCNAGTRCRNQCFEKREYPPLEPYWTETRGWGLKSSVDIQRGQFVIEYVGEVVDEEEFKRRMKRKYEAKDNNYYFLTIDKDRIIDAGPKGNLARFMNHSCSPNCETQKWTVNGDTRVGLFALCDIPAGTELTFNYNLDCAGNEKKVCKCEGVNCSGFIGVKAKNSVEKGDGKGRTLKRSELKQSEDECFVCQDGGELMVCDVRQCPKVYHLECVGLTEWPNETWLCPRHYCSLCNKSTKRCCKVCPNAFCYNHLDTNLFLDINSDLFCSNHVTSAVRSTQQIRKPSYVNRNTPVIEYEKPFAEKYRPPPLSQRRNSSEAAQRENEILMEPNLTDNTPILVENPLLSSTKVEESPAASSSRLNDGVSVKVFYVDEEGRIVNMDSNASSTADNAVAGAPGGSGSAKKLGTRKKKRTNIPRKKIYPHLNKDHTDGKPKSPSSASGINFESIMIKSVEDKILDSKLNIDNICNIIGGGVSGSGGNKMEGGTIEKGSDGTSGNLLESGNSEKCRDDTKPENKKDDAEVDRSRRSKYFKIITPEKFIKNSETSEPNPKTVTDFNYIEFMHPLKSSRSKTKTDENGKK